MKRFLTLAAFAFAATTSHALSIRPDRDDTEYLELATKYASAVRLPTGQGGVLVKDRWILTTAQAAKAIAAAPQPARITIAGVAYAVEEAFPHPEWRRPGGPNDVGLLLLRDVVKGVSPTPVHAGADEAGKTAVLVGFGPTGRIGDANARDDGKKRASINTVDRVSARELETLVKPVEDASDLQGALGPGDAGAPLFFDPPAGEMQVGGIFHAVEGNAERFVRASAYFGWIGDTMLEVAKRDAADLLGSQN